MAFETKTLEQWTAARVDLKHFLSVGDFVDDAIHENLLGAVPPLVNSSRFFQLGEPFDLVDGAETFTTLIKIGGRWMYAGHCHHNKTCAPHIGPVIRMRCACCDGWCLGRQWHNRDTGFGLCEACSTWLRTPKAGHTEPRESEEEIRRCNGIEGIHFNLFEWPPHTASL